MDLPIVPVGEVIVIPTCERHQWDPSEDECRHCGLPYCSSCLVYVNGANARPMCIHCALEKSGVRRSTRSRPGWRARRARKQLRTAATPRRPDTGEAEPATPAEPLEREPAVAAVEVEVDVEVDVQVEHPPARQPGWVSLDASRWDVRTL